jgi:hypothetical protein
VGEALKGIGGALGGTNGDSPVQGLFGGPGASAEPAAAEQTRPAE